MTLDGAVHRTSENTLISFEIKDNGKRIENIYELLIFQDEREK